MNVCGHRGPSLRSLGGVVAKGLCALTVLDQTDVASRAFQLKKMVTAAKAKAMLASESPSFKRLMVV